MGKKCLRINEGFIATTIAIIFALSIIGAYIEIRLYEPPEPVTVYDPNHGREDAYQALTRLIREDKASLNTMLEIAGDLPVDTYLDYEKASRQYTELAGMMRARGITSISRRPRMWVFETEYCGGIVTSSSDYLILYTTEDPRNMLTTWNSDDAEWVRTGSGWVQEESNIAYIEEIAEDFYYFFLAT